MNKVEKLTKEKYLIELLLSDSNLFSKCHTILKYDYFSPEYQSVVKFILEYSEKYNNVPTPKLILAETEFEVELHDVNKDLFNYACDEIEHFCQVSDFTHALTKCLKIYEQPGKLDTCIEIMKESLLVSLEKDLGLDYFTNPSERLQHILDNQNFQSTGYSELDELLGGGMVIGQMIVFSGNSGSGKSMTLSNLGLNLVELGLDVLYVSLELSEELISLRYDSLIAGHEQANWQKHIDDTVRAITVYNDNPKCGSLYVKYMPSGTNANQVRSYIKEFEIQNGKLPKVLLLDYLDIAGCNNSIGAENISIKDKYTSEEFRNLVNEYNMYLLTASQQNRGAINVTEPDQSHIAGGLTKANTSDFWFAIIRSDILKSENIVQYRCLKARSSDATGKFINLTWTPGSSRIKSMNRDNPISKHIMDLKEIDRDEIVETTVNNIDDELNTNLMNLIQ